MMFDFPSAGEDFFVITDVEAREVEPQLAAANDNDSDRSMDPDEARDYVDQFQDQPDLDSRGRINDRDLDVLEAVLSLNLLDTEMHHCTRFPAIVRPYSTYGTHSCGHQDSARSNCCEF